MRVGRPCPVSRARWELNLLNWPESGPCEPSVGELVGLGALPTGRCYNLNVVNREESEAPGKVYVYLSVRQLFSEEEFSCAVRSDFHLSLCALGARSLCLGI